MAPCATCSQCDGHVSPNNNFNGYDSCRSVKNDVDWQQLSEVAVAVFCLVADVTNIVSTFPDITASDPSYVNFWLRASSYLVYFHFHIDNMDWSIER